MENTNLKGTIYDMEKILEIQENRIHKIDGETYSEKELIRVVPLEETYRPRRIEVNSLSALCSLIKTEEDRHEQVIFVEVKDFKNVCAYTSYKENFERDHVYHAASDTPMYNWSDYLDHERSIIAIQSRFIQNNDTSYLLELLGSITVDNSVTSNDNGVTQQIEVKKGVSLKQKVAVKPFVSLAPYRTFLEIDQPESKMLLRVNDDANILLAEADGGMWKLAAKESIASYLKEQLKDLIVSDRVVILV